MEFEHESEQRLRREEAADRLRALADALSRHNEVAFVRDGRRVTIRVPDEVLFSLAVEVGEENELEVELKW